VTSTARGKAAWGLWLLGVVLLVAGMVVGKGGGSPWTVNVSQGAAFIAIGTVGAVVLTRSGATSIGWIYLGSFVGMALTGCATAYSLWAQHRHAFAGTTAEWMSQWGWVPVFGLLLPYSLLLFADGHLPSPRWRWVGRLTAAVVLAWTASFALEGADYTDATGRHVPNPYTTPTLRAVADPARVFLSFAFIALVAVAVVALVSRYRHGDEALRHQVRWLIPSGVLVVAWLALPFNHGGGSWVDVTAGVVLATLPVSVGVAITRYHLYDIDRLISRTTSYAVVTGMLVALYAVVVTAVPRLLPASSSFAVAVATLTAAAAFRPLLRRVRSAVDRRFDRAQFDAQRTVEAFGAQLRDEVDPGVVVMELLGAVERTMQPSQVRLAVTEEPT
jgi:hypothetical protein